MSTETRDHKITIRTNNSEICITDLSSVRAAAEKFLKITITGNNTQTDNGEINIAGMCTGSAVRSYKAEIDDDRNYHYVALCEAGVIDIVGNDNRILVVSNGQIINCSGTRNRISITGINAAIKGVKGNRIRLSVYDGNNLIGDLTGCIGETGLKENVLYRASGQFIEASVVEGVE